MNKIVIAILTVSLLGIFGLGMTVSAEGNKTDENFVKVFIHFDEDAQEGVRHGLVKAFGGELTHSFSIIEAVAARMPAGAIEGLQRNPHVTLIERDNEVQALGVTYDDEYSHSWGVSHIESGTAHESGNKGAGIKIGIIDSGVDYTHPDLDDNYRGGYDFYYWDNDAMDVYGHGTHVAGTACAEDNDNGREERRAPFGVVGVAPECDLYSLRVLGDSGSGFESDIVYAIEWALGKTVDIYWDGVYRDTAQGVRMDVVNLSLGSESAYSAASEAAFQGAADEGLIIVAAAGNSGNSAGTGENVIWPANFNSVIAVAATESTDARASFSSTGVNVELAAPGVSVYSTWNDGTSAFNPQPNCTRGRNPECYKYGSGTSMASPHVAGVAALLIKAGVAPVNVRTVLQDTSIDLGVNGRDEQYGYGLVNVIRALAGYVPNEEPVANAGVDHSVLIGEIINFDGTGSYDNDGTIVSYSWDFGDGNTGNGSTASHSYASVGTYTATLTVTDDEGALGTDTAVVTVTDPNANVAPVAVATTDTASALIGDPILFDGTGSYDNDGTIVSYSWDFGDGNTGNGSTTSHSYVSAGAYTAKLTVTDDDGDINDAIVSITITDPNASTILLSATGYKVKGVQHVDLSWSENTTNVDIYRDGNKIVTDLGGSNYTDNIGSRGNGTYTYEVCETGTTDCSDPVVVVIN